MALQIGGVSLSGLDASNDPAAVFQALATAYRFDEKIAKHLVETVGLDNWLDFVHVVTCEGEWEPIIARAFLTWSNAQGSCPGSARLGRPSGTAPRRPRIGRSAAWTSLMMRLCQRSSSLY